MQWVGEDRGGWNGGRLGQGKGGGGGLGGRLARGGGGTSLSDLPMILKIN